MSCGATGRLYSDKLSRTTDEFAPMFEGYQLIGDSQFLRFSEKLLKGARDRKNGLAYKGLCVSGQKTEDLLTRIKENFHPIYNKVILMIGTNDLLKNTNSVELRSNFDDLITYLIAKKKVRQLIVLTIPPVPRLVKSSEHWKTLKEYNKHILAFEGVDGLIKVIDAYTYFIIKSDALSCSSLPLSRNSPSSSSSCSSTNLRIQVEDVKTRTIFLKDGSDSEDDATEELDGDFGDISITATPSGKRSSSTFPTPSPKRQSLGSGSYNIAQDDHNDDMCYDDDAVPKQVDLSEKINEKYFEKYFDYECTRLDLIHLNREGLRLIGQLIKAAIHV